MRKMTKTLLATLALGVAFAKPVMADNLKIGVVDMRNVVSSAPQAKDAMEKLKKEFKAREERIQTAEKSLKDKTEKLQRNAAVMSEAEKSKLEKDVVAGQRDLQRMQTEFREDAASRQQEEMKKILDKVNTAIEEVAKKDKYDLILHKDAAPYSAKTVDITDKVVKAIGA